MILLLIGVFCVAVRVWGVDRFGLWYDEFCSVECSTGRGLWHETIVRDQLMSPSPRPTWFGAYPPRRWIWTSLDREQHPPLFYVLLHGWRAVFGSSDAAMRSLSIILAVVAVWFIFDAGRHWFGTTAGLWAAALMAAGNPMVNLSMEVRGYIPMLAMMAGATAMLARFEARGPTLRRAALLGGFVLAAMLTHYFALGGCAALGLYVLIRFGGRQRTVAIAGLVIAAGIYTLIWGPWLLQQRSNFDLNKNYLGEDPQGHAGVVARRLLLLPARFFNEPRTSASISASLFAAAYAVPWLLLRRSKPLLFVGLGLLVPIGLVATLDLIRSTAQLDLIRYTLVAAPAAYLFIGALPALLNGPIFIRHVIPAAALLACAIALPDAYRVSPYDPGNWRALAAALDRVAQADDAAVFIGGPRGDWFGGWLYLGTSHYCKSFPGTSVVLRDPASQSTLGGLKSRPAVWAVSGPGVDLAAMFPGWRIESVHQEVFLATIQKLTPPSEGR